MAEDSIGSATRSTREQRLATKLRENLRRRKEQARAQQHDEEWSDGKPTGGTPAGTERPLPKTPAKS